MKLIGDWCPPETLCREWDRMSQGQLRWNDIEITWEDRDVDFYVIVNRPWPGEVYMPGRTIVFQMEPWCGNEFQKWGVKTWGEWAEPDESRFLQVRSHRRHLNNAFWQLRATYQELKTSRIRKTRLLSTICGSKYFDPGHVKRVDFLKFLEAKDDDVVRVDIYAHDNVHGFRSYRGPLPSGVKDAGLLPYRYFFAAENNRERNFITEKLWEPLLTETLCFYWGCPNAADYIDPRAYVVLDLDDFEKAFRTIKATILANEWETRLDVIRREKQKVLEHYQFFPTLERVLRHELKLPDHPTDTEVVYHKYFADALGEDMRTVCFIHSLARRDDTSILEELLGTIDESGLLGVLDRLYVVSVGDEAERPRACASRGGKVRVIPYSTDARLSERPTLDLLRTFSLFHEGAKILYLHTKGASYDRPHPNVEDWRRHMLHFLVERFPRCLGALETSDAAGCDLLEHPRRHFSGNFWWANARYLRRLPPVPSGSRHEAEWWVLSGAPARVLSLHDSGVDHYREPYPRAAYALPARAAEARPVTRRTICLVMIVKDEAHIVCEALESILSHIADYVIVDTGSTDGTLHTIRSFFASREVQGRVFERAWKDFGWNRTEALSLAREHSTSEYLWMLDADDLVEGRPDLSALTADAYHLRFGPDFEFWRLQIFRRTLPWRYVGVLHEYPACDLAASNSGWVEGEYWIRSRRLGSRSRDPRTYERDAALLEAALLDEPENSRHVFYLAQSYFDAGQPQQALAAYRRRIEMGGAPGEVFYSRYRVARCLELLDHPFEDVQQAFMDCFREHPDRAEPLVRAAARARDAGRLSDAHALASRATLIPKPKAGALFVDVGDYEHRALDEQAIAAFYLGRRAESFSICSELLDRRDLPDTERARVEETRDLSVPFVKDELLRYDADLVRRITTRPRSGMARVTLSVTSCRRLGLFVGTMASFLNACTDLDLVDRWICFDDGSVEADRAEMQRLFPFFEFVFKGPGDKGHARSLNLIRGTVRTPYLVHLEDDWHFFARRAYIGPAIEILESNPGLGQVLLNRNYAETLEDREISGGVSMRSPGSGHRYVVHEHYPPDSAEYRRFREVHGERSCAYWPHFSLRPSVLRTGVFEHVGPFDEEASHFEREYAERYVRAGFRSAFFDGIHALHTGRLTSERGDPAKPNAYELNGEPQFDERRAAPVPPASGPRERCRVRLVGEVASSDELRAAFERQSKGAGRWDEVEITSGYDADYVAIFDGPGRDAAGIVPERSIVFQTRPPDARTTPERWVPPDPRRFVQVRSKDRFPVCRPWRLNRTYARLRSELIGPKSARLAATRPPATHDPGARFASGLLKHLETEGTSVDVFELAGVQELGDFPPAPLSRDGSEALFPYRYTIVVEDRASPNYFTERVLEALLAECLPFYWGCPNLGDHLDPRAFIQLPLDDLAASRRIVEEAMAQEEWARRIDAIRREKRRILDETQFFPTLARVVRGHRLASRLELRVINLDRRPDRLKAFQRQAEDIGSPSFAARVTRFPAIDGQHLTLTPELAHMFRDNDFGTRRGILACALSHVAVWRELADGDAPGVVVFEDDVKLCPGFTGQLVELCGQLETHHPGFDVAFLGHFDWQPRPEDDFAESRLAVRLRGFDGARFLGGTFAYLLSRQGARRLLTFVERDGIQNGIDRFIHRKAAELELLVTVPHLATSPLVPPGSGLDSDIENDFEPCWASNATSPGTPILGAAPAVAVGTGQRRRPVSRPLAGRYPATPAGSEDRHWAATMAFETYGRRVGIRASSPDILEQATDRLPPGWTPVAPTVVDRCYSLAMEPTQAAGFDTGLWVDGTELVRAPTLHWVLDALEGDLRRYIAEMARDRLFVHAGAVGWDGGVVLLPGRSWSGKTTLVAELVRAGATYYSDEYAVLDERGGVHPYPCRLGIRSAQGRRRRVGIESLGAAPGTDPLPVRLVVLTSYRQAGRWEPRRLSPAQGVLSVLAHTVAARRTPAVALSTLCTTLREATVLETERPEAAAVAETILALCPSAGRALHGHGGKA